MKKYYNIKRGHFLIKYFIIFINPANFSFLPHNVNINLRNRKNPQNKRLLSENPAKSGLWVLRHSLAGFETRFFGESKIENKEEVYF